MGDAFWLRRSYLMYHLFDDGYCVGAFWRNLKHQWLFINTLDNIATLRRLVAFYVNAHNTEMPHSAFNGQTPDEIYYGTGDKIPHELKEKREAARIASMRRPMVVKQGL